MQLDPNQVQFILSEIEPSQLSDSSLSSSIILTESEVLETLCSYTGQVMENPVWVNDRIYENQVIVRYVMQHGNKDPFEDDVDVNDPREFRPADKRIYKLCKHARKLQQRGILALQPQEQQ